MKRVLLLAENCEKFADLITALKQDENLKLTLAPWRDLEFWLDGTESTISISDSNIQLTDFDEILALTTPSHEHIHVMSALACYARRHQIKMLDDEFTNTSGKLYEMWRLWEQDVAVPKTAYGSLEFLAKAFVENLGGESAVLKSTHGAKGRDNYLVTSVQEITEIMTNHPETDYILQEFIPNDGDFRVICFNYEPQMVIYRSASGNDHRNNTSLGGTAKIIPLAETDEIVLRLANEAAKSLNIKFAGVDIICNRETGSYSILEVNRTPQLATGSYIEEKTELLKQYLSRD